MARRCQSQLVSRRREPGEQDQDEQEQAKSPSDGFDWACFGRLITVFPRAISRQCWLATWRNLWKELLHVSSRQLDSILFLVPEGNARGGFPVTIFICNSNVTKGCITAGKSSYCYGTSGKCYPL